MIFLSDVLRSQVYNHPTRTLLIYVKDETITFVKGSQNSRKYKKTEFAGK